MSSPASKRWRKRDRVDRCIDLRFLSVCRAEEDCHAYPPLPFCHTKALPGAGQRAVSTGFPAFFHPRIPRGIRNTCG